MSVMMMLSLEISIEDSRWQALALADLAEAAAKAVLADQGVSPAFEISLLACDDARIAALNADFRGKPVPTNVLSWPAQERRAEIDGAVPPKPVLAGPMGGELGDIALAYETCAAEAAAAGKPLAEHVTHLVVHALLHLLGYDHEREKDAALMEASEVRILERMGIKDPYH